jgi:hypothetical protein
MASQSPFLSDLHEAARAWAEAGFYVFPCAPLTKRPAVENGFHQATTDAAQIDAWWSDNPNFNIGVAPARSAMFVLDQDGPLGAETIARLTTDHGLLPTTLTIRTPRGPDNLHYWFKGSCPSTVAKLGAKVDTRGEGGYVLVPPSIVSDKGVHGEYSYPSEENEIAEGPAWITETIREGREHVAGAAVQLDLESNIARAIALLVSYVADDFVAVQGEGGDNRTYTVAAEVLNLGLSVGKTFEVIRDHWNDHCVPPWPLDELQTKVANAAEYSQNEQGAWATPPAATIFAGMEKFAVATKHDPKPNRFYPRDESEQDARPAPTWLLENMLPDQATVIMYGQPYSGKSFLALHIALTLASGIAGFGLGPREPVETVYAAAEGARGIEKLRRPAWREANKLTFPLPFYTIDSVPMIGRPQEVIELIEAIKARKLRPRLLILDTVARMMTGKNENDARDAGELVEALDFLKRELRCTVMAVHHTGKDDERGARGSSAILAGVDTGLEVKVKGKDGLKAFSLHVRRQKDADEPAVPWTFEGRDVANSMALFEIDTAAFNRITKGEDAFGHAKIAAALHELGAIGEARGISTQVLAIHLTPPLMGEDPEEMQRAQGRVARQLSILVKTKLQGYASGDGRHLRWHLPSDVSNPEL